MEVRPPPESVRIWFVGWQVECGRVGSDCEYLNGGWHRQSAQVTKVDGTRGGAPREVPCERWVAPGSTCEKGGWHREEKKGGWHREDRIGRELPKSGFLFCWLGNESGVCC